MYQETLAKLTADHLREHIATYLTEISAEYNDNVTLVIPKSIEFASNVGGIAAEFDQILPAYVVDVLEKTRAADPDNLTLYDYAGHIAGMVSAGSMDTVDKLVKRHAEAVERFIKQHLVLHLPVDPRFSMTQFVFLNSAGSGAEEVEDGRWLGAFRIECLWTLSEDAEFQHG